MAILACSYWKSSQLSPSTTAHADRRGKRRAATGQASTLAPPCPRTPLATPTRPRSHADTKSSSPNPRQPRHCCARRPRQPRHPSTILSTWRRPSLPRTSQTCCPHHPGPVLASRSVEHLADVTDGELLMLNVATPSTSPPSACLNVSHDR